MTRNRLDTAHSPYLRMHAANPVHWQPWDDEALQLARDTDTPILLSIGYSACHWCHVMAHECFENAAIAGLMNQSFVNIKLDREQRPDIDQVYQLAHQAMTGRGGGWPLTAFLDPRDLVPFYIGTYFPPEPRHGLPAFSDVLRQLRAYFDEHRAELGERAGQLREWLAQANETDAALPDLAPATDQAMARLVADFDAQWGGTQGAPKFPRAAHLEWLLERVDDPQARAMARLTLGTMARRGLRDQLGGGFFRYCVDAAWTIPHFEKMLYDNAQLLPLYARLAVALDATDDERALACACIKDDVDFLVRELMTPDGTFYSALHADSEGEEGRFYLWTRAQVDAALAPADQPLAMQAYGLDRPPNFEGRAWHLLRDRLLVELPVAQGQDRAVLAGHLETIRARLLARRAERMRPPCDDNILVAWNALAIAGLARTARILDDARCAELARRALAGVRQGAWIDGGLAANVTAHADARIPGFLDDHALLLDAVLEVLQLQFSQADLTWAVALADALCQRFADADKGGFRFSATGHHTPLLRMRVWADDALPAGNGVAIRGLLRLGHLLGNTRYLDVARAALAGAGSALHAYPQACPSLLRALAEDARPRLQVVVRSAATRQARWRDALNKTLDDMRIETGGDALDSFFIADDEQGLPGLLAERDQRTEAGTAWVCSGHVCQAPVSSPEGLAAALKAAMSMASD
ncbi:MAG TPA: thioredoxin domain-containing protein [Rhodanobacteraceae bacterium]